jgi:hypothetical protein
MNRDTYKLRGEAGMEALVVVEGVNDGMVHFFPYGGGFVVRRPEVEFHSKYEKVTDQEIEQLANTYRAAMFCGDWFSLKDDQWLPSMPGYTNGHTWNGWATPLFEKDVVLEAMKDQRLGGFGLEKMEYREDRDVFLILHDYGCSGVEGVDVKAVFDEAVAQGLDAGYLDTTVAKHGIEGQVEICKAQMIVAGNEVKKVYAIGDGWCWYEDQPEDQAVVEEIPVEAVSNDYLERHG